MSKRRFGAAAARWNVLRHVAVGCAVAVALCVGSTAMAQQAAAEDRPVSPGAAATASFLLPGLGQVMNGDYAEGALQAGLYFMFAYQYLKRMEDPDYIAPEDREDTATNTIRINRPTVIADQYGLAATDLALYSSFAAYRDARAHPALQGSYRTPAPRESLTDLSLAPFQWEYLKRPTTLAPLAIPFLLLLLPVQAEQLVYDRLDDMDRGELAARFFVQHAGVAIGEEAFFRGVLNNAFSDSLGPGWGLLSSSAVFGLAHSGEGGTAPILGASVFGLYLGYLQQRNEYDIRQGVAIHFWWNFLTSVAFLRSHENATVTPFALYLRF